MVLMEFKKCCPIADVNGKVEAGKQFDIDIVLPEDNRDVIYGVIKDCYKEPVKDAVVKLLEVKCEDGKEQRRPVTHTFTDCEGEFVLGPLCPGKIYAIDIFVNRVQHVKICAKCNHEGECLKGVRLEKCDCFLESEKCEKKHDDCKECECQEKKEENCPCEKEVFSFKKR